MDAMQCLMWHVFGGRVLWGKMQACAKCYLTPFQRILIRYHISTKISDGMSTMPEQKLWAVVFVLCLNIPKMWMTKVILSSIGAWLDLLPLTRVTNKWGKYLPSYTTRQVFLCLLFHKQMKLVNASVAFSQAFSKLYLSMLYFICFERIGSRFK